MMAAILSFVLCIGWEFYYMSPEEYTVWVSLTGLGFFKWAVSMAGTGFATWLASSKIYDLSHGDKKRRTRVLKEKKVLEEKIVVLQNGSGDGEKHEEPAKPVEENDLASRLREALGEGE
jgi:hypothetical protein